MKNIPTTAKFISVFLSLCEDIPLNPDPVSFGVINCQSDRNKGLTIANIVSSRSLDLLVLTEMHIRPTYIESLLHLITPRRYKLCHRPCAHSLGGGSKQE